MAPLPGQDSHWWPYIACATAGYSRHPGLAQSGKQRTGTLKNPTPARVYKSRCRRGSCPVVLVGVWLCRTPAEAHPKRLLQLVHTCVMLWVWHSSHTSLLLRYPFVKRLRLCAVGVSLCKAGWVLPGVENCLRRFRAQDIASFTKPKTGNKVTFRSGCAYNICAGRRMLPSQASEVMD